MRLGYPLPCDVCTRTVIADSRGCIVYPPPNSGSCINVSKVELFSFRNFIVTPSSVDLQAPPASFTITGEAISGAYGMPKVEFWNQNEILQHQTTASAIAADGTWLQVATPDLSQVYSGQYYIEVSNIKADGTTEIIGIATVETYGRDEPPPEECRPDGYCAEWDYVNCYCLRN